MNVLVVDDDKSLANRMCKILSEAGHSVMLCDSVSKAVNSDLERFNDVIVLDLMLGEERGRDLVEHLRSSNNGVPILVVSGNSEVKNKVELLKMGADDYLTKPFDSEEFFVRVESLYRRYLEAPSNREQVFGEVVFNWVEAKVIRGEKVIALTGREVQFLKLLVANGGRVVRSSEIIKKVWDVGAGYHSNILQSLVKRLRRRVDGGFKNKLLHNVHGVGYFIKLN